MDNISISKEISNLRKGISIMRITLCNPNMGLSQAHCDRLIQVIHEDEEEVLRLTSLLTKTTETSL